MWCRVHPNDFVFVVFLWLVSANLTQIIQGYSDAIEIIMRLSQLHKSSDVITLTSQWAQWRLKSPASGLFIQLFIQVQVKENIRKLRVTGLCVENPPGTGEFSAQKASNADNVFIWWRHHVVMKPWWIWIRSYTNTLRTGNVTNGTYSNQIHGYT